MTPAPALLIIGAGHAGGRCAQALREQGYRGAITLVGDEPEAAQVGPYERPPLSKGLLTGSQTAAQCALRPAQAWADDAITLATSAAAALDLAAHELHLSDGQRLPWHALLLATGGRARRLAIPGADLPGVLTLRTLADAQALSPRLLPGARIVVIGGGFIGLEVAASARQRGCNVQVVEAGPRLLGRVVPAALAERVAALHLAQGVGLQVGTAPVAIEAIEATEQSAVGHGACIGQDGHGGPRTGLALRLADGRVLRADTIVVGIGISPAVGLAQAAGLAIGATGGVVVDATLHAGHNVYAVGDCSEFPSPLSGRPTRQETWHNAETQARVAAHNMRWAVRSTAGDGPEAPQPYQDLPWFWSDQFDHQLQVAGEPALASHTVERPMPDGALLHFHLAADGSLVGACGLGPTSTVARELKLARMLVERRMPVTTAQLADPAVALKALLKKPA